MLMKKMRKFKVKLRRAKDKLLSDDEFIQFDDKNDYFHDFFLYCTNVNL